MLLNARKQVKSYLIYFGLETIESLVQEFDGAFDQSHLRFGLRLLLESERVNIFNQTKCLLDVHPFRPDSLGVLRR